MYARVIRSKPILQAFFSTDVTFLRPWWLLGLPLAAALFWAGARRAADAGSWAGAVDAPLLAAMARRGGFGPGATARRWPLLCAALLLALALAGPAAENSGAAALQNLDALVLVADLSGREADDAATAQLRFMLRRLADSAGGRQVGLIIYAGDAYTVTALTSDPDIAAAAVAALDAGVVPDPGARPDIALALAQRVLQGGGRSAAVVSADVALVSGGAAAFADDTRQAALALRGGGYTLHTVFIPPSSAPPDAAGRAALAALAQVGGGMAVEASAPEALLAQMQQRPVQRWRSSMLAGLAWNDYGRFLAAMAALASLTLFRRRAA